ncbi:MAG: nucleoside/nucleotide kinase family protein, partial [Rhizobiaceae bacterium]
IAGAPGSGKSTVAADLEGRLNATVPGLAALLPMDGFHFDDTLLDRLGRRDRKGAPDTFDVAGLRVTLERLARNDEPEIVVPVFDRTLEIARAGARAIDRSVAIIVVEGNYLLLDAEPWRSLHGLFDMTVMLETPEEDLRRRLVERWSGLGLSPREIARKVEENDLPNGRKVGSGSIAAHWALAN